MMSLLFGTNFLLFCLFQFINWFKSTNQTVVVDNKKKEKELAKPFDFSLDSFTHLTTDLFQVGLILLLTYVCENHWVFEHSGKDYNRDLFIFVLILFFLYAFYTIKPNHDLTLLGREQTEEWKGWMQFIFLLYHYFHAEEVYNSVRVMITCYVWMTGFGNFSFFYMKKDFGWLRVVQMLWRLNFSVLLLMWTHGNTYILYYICPMHTFYFFMVYLTMYAFHASNHMKWPIRFKLMALGLIIYLVWDINGGLFDWIFAFMGTTSVIGAGRGSVWEYYFRTSLDHWSAFFGMIFALNFPLAEQYFNKAKGLPLTLASVLMGALTVYWFFTFYMKEKLEYNLTHSYTAIIPLTAYIFFRNVTPWTRSYVSMSLHDLGKTTLETYLLQHHIWLTSNAKTLLTIVPGHPWVNFALATLLFFAVSKELYRLTMNLRGMLLPDDKRETLRNLGAIAVVLAVFYSCAVVISVKFTLITFLIAVLTLFLVLVLLMNRFCPKLTEHSAYYVWSNRSVPVAAVALLLAVAALLSATSQSVGDASSTASPVSPPGAEKFAAGLSAHCQSLVGSGGWTASRCDDQTSTSQYLSPFKLNTVALCDTDQWRWSDEATADCPIGRVPAARAKALFSGKQVVFVGDSIVRGSYHQLISYVDSKYKMPNDTIALKHADLTYTVGAMKNATFKFYWAPFMRNVSDLFQQKVLAADLLVTGAALWDALYARNLGEYTESFSRLAGSPTVSALKDGSVAVWLQPTRIVNGQLSLPDKRVYMTEEIVQTYRTAVTESPAARFFYEKGAVVNPAPACVGREGSSVDGIHYDSEVNQVIVQMILNAYAMHFPASYVVPKPSTRTVKQQPPKATGSMSFPVYGAYVLALAFIMLFAMDNWLGLGYLSLRLFGRSFDYDAAYGALIAKIEGSGGAAKAAGGAARGHKASEGENEKDSFLVSADDGQNSKL